MSQLRKMRSLSFQLKDAVRSLIQRNVLSSTFFLLSVSHTQLKIVRFGHIYIKTVRFGPSRSKTCMQIQLVHESGALFLIFSRAHNAKMAKKIQVTSQQPMLHSAHNKCLCLHLECKMVGLCQYLSNKCMCLILAIFLEH